MSELARTPFQKAVIRVAMLGPSGVGKTSMLASMHDRLGEIIGPLDLQVSPKGEASAVLADKLSGLRSLFANDTTMLLGSGGIPGDKHEATFVFEVGRKARKPVLNISFVDYPGGFLSAAATDTERGWLEYTLATSHVILIPIDTPALVEKGGSFHEQVNGAAAVNHLVQAAFRGLDGPRLVILAPMRCEYATATAANLLEVNKLLKQEYAQLLAFLAHPSVKPYVTVAITPIQTLGGIVFHSIADHGQNGWRPFYSKRGAVARYAPMDTEQPLRHVFDFALRLHRVNRTSGIFGTVYGVFGDKALFDAAVEIAGKIKNERAGDAGFEIVQTTAWTSLAKLRSGQDGRAQ
jgi:hypothetical protein